MLTQSTQSFCNKVNNEFQARQELYKYVDNLIRDHSKIEYDRYEFKWDSLTDGDREEFAGHIIKYQSHIQEGFDFLLNSLSCEELSSQFSDCILSYGEKQKEKKEKFLSDLISEAKYFLKNAMRLYVQERIEEVEHEDGIGLSYKRERDMDLAKYNRERI